MKLIGVHIEEAKLSDVPAAAHELGARAFSFCPVNALRWKSAPIPDKTARAFVDACAEYGFSSACVLPHSSLLLNLCSPDSHKLEMSRTSLVQQINACASLGLAMLNFHPGATVKEISESEALIRVADSINYALDQTEGVTAVIENTAGQGSNVGYSFEHLAAIIDRVEDKTRVGVCIDTCHACAAGYDMTNPAAYEKVWNEFGSTIGFDYLRGMHINDALKPTGSRVDRHAPIGKGTLGNAFFAMLMADARFDGIPLILETPDPLLWRTEIEQLYSVARASLK